MIHFDTSFVVDFLRDGTRGAMKTITLENYRADKYYPRVVRAVAALLAKSATVAPVDVFVEMNLLQASDPESWRFGRIPYLEKVIRCNLAVASRILRILRMHVHDLNLQPSLREYRKWGKGPKLALRFTKSSDPGVEEAYRPTSWRQSVSLHPLSFDDAMRALLAVKPTKEARERIDDSDKKEDNS